MQTTSRTTDTVEITLREDAILVVRTHDGANQALSDARSNLAVCREMLAERAVPVLVDVRGTGVLEPKARHAYGAEAEFAVAQAILVDSPFSRVAANLFLRVARPKQPTQLFTDESSAVSWLRTFVK